MRLFEEVSLLYSRAVNSHQGKGHDSIYAVLACAVIALKDVDFGCLRCHKKFQLMKNAYFSMLHLQNLVLATSFPYCLSSLQMVFICK